VPTFLTIERDIKHKEDAPPNRPLRSATTSGAEIFVEHGPKDQPVSRPIAQSNVAGLIFW
jgi:hypothetical protein